MSLLSPLALIGLLLAVPVILLYMLRLRRRETVVSSTFLWSQLLQDKEANTPWQRLRRNLLLILQLIILALLVFALARPFVTVPAINAARVALVLDASASMGALDGENGVSRFAQAQAEAVALIGALGAGAEVSVIRAADPPEILIPYTQDRAMLTAAVESAAVSEGGADWLAALTLASAGGQGSDNFTIVLVTDGGLSGLEGLSEAALPGRVRVIPVGSSDENVALSALAVRSLGGGTPQLFARMTNYGSTEAEVILTLRADGDPVPVFSERLTLPAGASQAFASSRGLGDASVLHATLTTTVASTGRDLLAADNSAWTVAQTVGERRVLLVTTGNLFLEQVFRSLPGIDVVPRSPDDDLPAEPFDLYVFDGVVPKVIPAGDMLFIGPPEGVRGWFTVGAETYPAGNIDTMRSDERMTFVDFDAVSILKYRALGGLAWADTLVSVGDAPLVVAGSQGGQQAAVFAFALADSDLPLQIAFPVLMSNLLDWFSPVGSLLNPTPRVGEPVIIQPPLGADAVRITRPDGAAVVLPATGDPLVFGDTAQRGLYQLEAFSGGDVLQAQTFAVNLFSDEESRIAPQTVTLGGVTLVQQSLDELGQLEFWPLLALLALAVLMLEWWFYQRRSRLRVTPPAPARPRSRFLA